MTIASRFVAAGAPDYGARKGPALGIVVHMTEGSGTEADVAYLAGSPARGVSVHYVILATGEIVQMLAESRASGSINPGALRTTDDAPFTSPDGALVRYGASAARAVLGAWWRDPNSAVISVEIGGRAVDGPNARQSEALARLVADVASRHPGIRPLGHRDFQNYKACPGRLIRWGMLGGHGPAAPEEDDMVITRLKAEDWRPAAGRASSPLRAKPDRKAPGIASVQAGQTVRSIAEIEAGGESWRLTERDGAPAYLLRSDYDPVEAGGDPATDALLDALLARQALSAPVIVAVNGRQVYP